MGRRFAFFVLLFTIACGVAQAQTVALDSTPPSRAQVLKLMSAMGIQETIDASLKGAQAKLKLTAHNSFQKKYPDADAATLKKLDSIFDSTPLFTFESMTEALIPVYQKNLSAEDVQAGIDFYTSESGKRLLAKLPLIVRESNETGGQLVRQKLTAYSEELERKLEDFQSQLDKEKPKVSEKSKAADEKSSTKDKASK